MFRDQRLFARHIKHNNKTRLDEHPRVARFRRPLFGSEGGGRRTGITGWARYDEPKARVSYLFSEWTDGIGVLIMLPKAGSCVKRALMLGHVRCIEVARLLVLFLPVAQTLCTNHEAQIRHYVIRLCQLAPPISFEGKKKSGQLFFFF